MDNICAKLDQYTGTPSGFISIVFSILHALYMYNLLPTLYCGLDLWHLNSKVSTVYPFLLGNICGNFDRNTLNRLICIVFSFKDWSTLFCFHWDNWEWTLVTCKSCEVHILIYANEIKKTIKSRKKSMSIFPSRDQCLSLENICHSFLMLHCRRMLWECKYKVIHV